MQPSPKEPCPVCGSLAEIHLRPTFSKIICKRCGTFRVTDIAAPRIELFTDSQRACVSGWIREHPDITISERDCDNLERLQAPSVGEKAERLLSHLAQECPKAGALIDLNITANGEIPDEDCDYTVVTPEYLTALTWSHDGDEL